MGWEACKTNVMGKFIVCAVHRMLQMWQLKDMQKWFSCTFWYFVRNAAGRESPPPSRQVQLHRGCTGSLPVLTSCILPFACGQPLAAFTVLFWLATYPVVLVNTDSIGCLEICDVFRGNHSRKALPFCTWISSIFPNEEGSSPTHRHVPFSGSRCRYVGFCVPY